ncbi:hypothetical protein IQ244_07420 [Nostoc sp. LEGE 06077]|uniref:hypothetical protein n=1 Tax=Nostoc sp. LEGE 06077 TaxID=915325 RepID=UPI001880F1C4|nr:hypothetical protein [Nostoc sp. LEGE 06077]MBE9206343.1 hypothetical protein [Nostoc sp. LEGE 06077]
MRITVNESISLAKVIEPAFDGTDIYLDETVLDYLEQQDRLNKLENMQFFVELSLKAWSISGEPPVGTPGTIASLIFYVSGSLKENELGIICTLP